MLFSKLDVTLLVDVFGNFVTTCTDEFGINPLYSYSLPGYTWKAELKITKPFFKID